MAAAVEVDTAAAAIPDDDAQPVTVDPHELNVLKGPRKGVLHSRSFFHADLGSLASRFTSCLRSLPVTA